MKLGKSTIVALAILTIITMIPSLSYAQWGELFGGFIQAVGERYIDNSNYSSDDKEKMKNDINTISNAIHANQNARNATRDAYNGNYTGAVIQGTQTLMNAAGNHNYDTYFNSANQINNANREYKQDVQNGMDRQEALDKRNTTIGNSAAVSVVELQDKIAQQKLEEVRKKRELESQSRENDNYYSQPSYYETNTSTSTTNLIEEKQYNASETSRQILHDNAVSNNKSSDFFVNVDEYRSYNKNSQILSSSNSVRFLTDEGKSIYLHVLFHGYNEGSYLSYNNNSDKTRLLSCNKVYIKVKYVGDNIEQTFTDACSFVMPAHTSGSLEWSDVFPNLSDKFSDADAIESIKMCFVETQINDVNAYRNHNTNAQILSSSNSVKFMTDEGEPIYLHVLFHDEGEGSYVSYYNHSDKTRQLSCNRVSIKVKYYGDEVEQTISDACSFIMPAHKTNNLEWSDIFFNIPETRQIESIKVMFIDTQIK